MTESAHESAAPGNGGIAGQAAALPAAWRYVDGVLVRGTEVTLFAIGMLFTAMIALEVVSRYVFGFSIFFVNAAAKFLLLWFFILGSGLALRHGAHVGFELLLTRLQPGLRRGMRLFIQVLGQVFFAEMVWSGIVSLGPAWGQVDSALDISLGWAFLAVPIGFSLLMYHMTVLMIADYRGATAEGI